VDLVIGQQVGHSVRSLNVGQSARRDPRRQGQSLVSGALVVAATRSGRVSGRLTAF
jgi:hypothetical protein